MENKKYNVYNRKIPLHLIDFIILYANTIFEQIKHEKIQNRI